MDLRTLMSSGRLVRKATPGKVRFCLDPDTASIIHAIPSLPLGAGGRAALAQGYADLVARWRPDILCEIGSTDETVVAADALPAGLTVQRHETVDQAASVLPGRTDAVACLRLCGTADPAEALRRNPALLARSRALLLDMGDAARDGTIPESMSALRATGLTPVVRDRYDGDSAFNVLFIRDTWSGDMGPAELDRLFAKAGARRTARPGTSTGPRYPDAGLPVVVPVFENPTFARMMVAQLLDHGFSDIIVADNASRSPDMLACLEDLAPRAHVERLEQNMGPRKTLKSARIRALLPRYFAVTDPDIGFNPALPAEFVAVLKAALSTFDVGKAGFALDISDREALVDTRFQMKAKTYHIWEHERNFWSDFAGETGGGDPVFRAGLDTTFAVYDRKRFGKRHFLEAVRLGGRFTAQHLPWLRAIQLDPEELERYQQVQKYSHYQAQAGA
ncbi:hypothetical protein [Salibaculum sp.]|uniref:hypothetical protein n=1 Tax=Salibaculum sp. TaxID=2855480 RepID=UPI002B472FC2|nr:hypothetical protein [Salibaculum sp.]HKL69583.1 hypothetical protein [Salibaculum sp.]